jgi:hypothetical protein
MSKFRLSGKATAFAAVASAVIAAVVATAPPAAVADATRHGGDFVRLANEGALLDTRSGLGGVPKAPIAGGKSVTFPVLGVGGVPSTGVKAVLLDVVAVSPTASTWFAVYPSGEGLVGISNLNVAAGSAPESNTAAVAVGTDGKVSLYNNAGNAHAVVNVQGYYTSSTASSGPGGLVAVPHTRVVDTRSGLGGVPKAQLGSGQSLTVTLTGSVIPVGADSVYLDLVVTNATNPNWLATYPAGGAASTISTFNFLAGTTSEGASVKLSSDGKAVFVNHSSAPIDLVLTAEGYTSSTPNTDAGYRPVRMRLTGGTSVGAQATVDVQVGGRPGIPTSGITAAAVSFTTSDSTAGYLHAWPKGGSETVPSLLNYGSGIRSSFALIATGTDTKITIRNVSSKAIRLWVDLEGYYTTESPSVAPVAFAPTVGLQVPAVDSTAPAPIEYAYVDNVGRLVTGLQADPINFDTIAWTVISTIGDIFSGQPSLTVAPDKTLQATARYGDTGVRTNVQSATANRTWAPSFTNIGGSFATPPTVATLPDGSLVAFAVDAGGALWVRPQSGSTQYWQTAGSVNLRGKPVAVTTANGVQVYGTTSSGTVETATYSAGVMSAWTDLGGSGVTDPPAVAVRQGYLDQVVVRQGDGSIVTKAQAFDGSFPAAWSVVGVPGAMVAQGAPAAMFDLVTGQVVVVVRSAADSNLYGSAETVQGSQVFGDWVSASKGLVSATDPTTGTFQGGSNGTAGWFVPFRMPDGSTVVSGRIYSNGAATPGSLKGTTEPLNFTVHRLPPPPA